MIVYCLTTVNDEYGQENRAYRGTTFSFLPSIHISLLAKMERLHWSRLQLFLGHITRREI